MEMTPSTGEIGYTRWRDIRAEHVARAGGEEAVRVGKEELVAQATGSLYCSEGSSCVNVTEDARGLLLCESDVPEVTIPVAPRTFRDLLLTIKAGTLNG
ncbi:hypothetical protein [Streptomyces sp. NPDC003077]|uniref:hypothetical protein n=1 Tax=Streptomyces sp. NPDC003077 TaxID=3154443 RepID=UPI0033AC2477